MSYYALDSVPASAWIWRKTKVQAWTAADCTLRLAPSDLSGGHASVVEVKGIRHCGGAQSPSERNYGALVIARISYLCTSLVKGPFAAAVR